MFRTTRRVFATGLFATISLCAAAGGGGDPIINDYAGTAVYRVATTLAGLPLPGGDDVQVGAWTMSFAPANMAQINAFDGIWKRKGKRYRVDCSPDATDHLRMTTQDSNARETFKCSKIALQLGVGITGKLKSASVWHSDLLLLRATLNGSFGCPIDTGP